MSKSKKDMLKQGRNADLLDQATVRHGLKMSDVRYETITTFRANPQNTVLFREETPEYFARLRKDIQERGIIVPLIAKLDGTLLAGHNRLRIAEELHLREVPVQYLLEQISAEEEKGFVIKDNLLRRQFTYEQWTAIFRELVPNYDKRIQEESRGRKKKSSATINGQMSEFQKKESLTQELTERTGLNERTIRRINEAARKKLQPEKYLASSKTPFTVKKAVRPPNEELLQMAEILALHFNTSEKRIQNRIQKILHYVIRPQK